MRDPLGRGYYRFPVPESNLDAYIKQASIKREKQAEQDPFKESDLNQFGGVWERDIDALSNDYISLKEKIKEYEKTKDPKEKAKKNQEIIKMGARLETNINKSKINFQQYRAKKEQLNKDQKFFYPADSDQILENWASTSIYDRPDDIGIDVPSTLSFQKEFDKQLQTALGKKDFKSEKVTTASGDSFKTNIVYYYEPEDIDQAVEQAYAAMPQNFKNAETYRLQQRAVDPNESEAVRNAAKDALGNTIKRDEYLMQIGRAYSEPNLTYKGSKLEPKKETGAGGAGGKEAKITATEYVKAFQNPATGETEKYAVVSSARKDKKAIQRDYIVSKDVLLRYAEQNPSNGFFTKSAIQKSPEEQLTIGGTFSSVFQNEKGDTFVTITPYTFAGKYKTAQAQLTLPIVGNEATVNADLPYDYQEGLRIAREKAKKANVTGPTKTPSGVGVKQRGPAAKPTEAPKPKRTFKTPGVTIR